MYFRQLPHAGSGALIADLPAQAAALDAPRKALHDDPDIIWIPAGLRRREDLVAPLDNFRQRMNVRFHQGKVTGLAEGGRHVNFS